MNIVQDYPPNYDAICEAISGVKSNKNIVFTYGDTIYSPSTAELADHLRQHEAVHIGQQKQMGRDEWWTEYLMNPEFRLQQEIQAYRVQYKVIFKKGNWRNTEMLLSSIARDLSGAMYGNMISYEVARSLITRSNK